MADIRQAAKWLNLGLRVRRNIWGSDTYIFRDHLWQIMARPSADEQPHDYALGVLDLIAEDWETL